jgi:hypothetical protein
MSQSIKTTAARFATLTGKTLADYGLAADTEVVVWADQAQAHLADIGQTVVIADGKVVRDAYTALMLAEIEVEEEEAGIEAALEEARAARDEEAERQAWDGSDDAEEVARMLTPGQAWEEYVGSQSVAEWVANDGPTDTDGIEEYLAQTWPRDTDETARPIVARKLADYLNAPTTEPVTGSGWYELTNGLVQRIDWRAGRMVEGAIVAGWDAIAAHEAAAEAAGSAPLTKA